MQRPFRLRRHVDFDRVRAQGQQWRHPLVTMTIAPNELSYNRYGFVASRRLGSAVVRNRTRRVLREVLRRANPRLRAGYDIVFIARNALLEQPYNRVDQALGELFRRANLWLMAEEEAE